MIALFISSMIAVSGAVAETQPAASAVEALLTEDSISSLRNPFRPSDSIQKNITLKRNEIETFPVQSMVLNGVIAGLKKSKAMITLPNSKTVFVKVGDKIGNRDGHVVAINSDGVRVMEYDKDEDGKLVADYVQISILNKPDESASRREE